MTSHLPAPCSPGDHKQLRPSVEVYQLGRDFQLDVSLFERLVNNHAPVVTLGVQHRMAPCIAALVSPAIYPDLQNSASVGTYPEVPGLPKRMFFVDHAVFETNTVGGLSQNNDHGSPSHAVMLGGLTLTNTTKLMWKSKRTK